MIEGQRYLFLSYGPLSTSGVFRRLLELGPGVVAVEVVDYVNIGETGPIDEAVRSGTYEPGQSGKGVAPLKLIPWHDISGVEPQGF